MFTLCKFIGNIGEKCAEKYLKTCGYSILARQYRVSFVEIDIVAEKHDALYLFEVKSVSHRNIDGSPFHPVRRVSKKKVKKMTMLADYYLNAHPQYSTVFIGIIVVILSDTLKKPQIEVVWV